MRLKSLELINAFDSLRPLVSFLQAYVDHDQFAGGGTRSRFSAPQIEQTAVGYPGVNIAARDTSETHLDWRRIRRLLS